MEKWNEKDQDDYGIQNPNDLIDETKKNNSIFNNNLWTWRTVDQSFLDLQKHMDEQIMKTLKIWSDL